MSDNQRGDDRPRAARGNRPRTPTWVKAFGLAGLGVAIVVLILHLTGNGMVWH